MLRIDMQMPNNCFVCPLNDYGECRITDKSVPDYNEDETIVERPSECPLHDKGEWLLCGGLSSTDNEGNEISVLTFKCSVCGEVVDSLLDYCPNCKTEMK